ncbi:MAG TPA: WYL domain-containing protein [Candidatus Dormibacteraeota bacterium]|jgi:predicted DNA-binding transcriptional regulator YafY|nr:WYL domain-containing protein [Candidatus Dormibacteraeota bacterium]
MRADRLVATLLILPSRTRLTANDLARELEISERTARRDLEALAMAGVPVYAQPGRNGGWSLLGGARTDLSGLTAAEARTLFLVAGPSAATPEVKAALRKLVRALPETFRAAAQAAASAVVVDPAEWDRSRAPSPPHLDVLRNAVVDGVQVRIAYAGRDRAEGERVVHPLGLVAKGRAWYLVASTAAGQRTFRVDRVRSVEVTADPVDRPPGFDLEATWQATLETLQEQRHPHTATVLAPESLLPVLRYVLGTRVTPTGRAVDGGEPGRIEVEVRERSAEMIARQLAGFGTRIEVVGPPDVREALARIGAELTQRYG